MKHTRRWLSITIIFILFSCYGCANKFSNKLADYKNIKIDKDYVTVSDSDIENIITLDYSSSNFYQENKNKSSVDENDIILMDIKSDNQNLNVENYYYNFGESDFSNEIDNALIGKKVGDVVTSKVTYNNEQFNISIYLKGIYMLQDIKDEKKLEKFYKMNSRKEVYDYLRSRAQKEIIFNYMWNTILENSSYYELPEKYEDKIKEKSKNISNENEKQEVYDYYYELVIGEKILEKENIIISDSDIYNTKIKISNKNNIPINSLSEYISEDDVYYATVMDILKDVLYKYAIIEN